jgi:hypothetical protein
MFVPMVDGAGLSVAACKAPLTACEPLVAFFYHASAGPSEFSPWPLFPARGTLSQDPGGSASGRCRRSDPQYDQLGRPASLVVSALCDQNPFVLAPFLQTSLVPEFVDELRSLCLRKPVTVRDCRVGLFGEGLEIGRLSTGYRVVAGNPVLRVFGCCHSSGLSPLPTNAGPGLLFPFCSKGRRGQLRPVCP